MSSTVRILFVLTPTLLGIGGVAAVATWSFAQTPPTPGSVIYRYDSLRRIAQDIYPTTSAAYSYDKAGNRTSLTMN